MQPLSRTRLCSLWVSRCPPLAEQGLVWGSFSKVPRAGARGSSPPPPPQLSIRHRCLPGPGPPLIPRSQESAPLRKSSEDLLKDSDRRRASQAPPEPSWSACHPPVAHAQRARWTRRTARCRGGGCEPTGWCELGQAWSRGTRPGVGPHPIGCPPAPTGVEMGLPPRARGGEGRGRMTQSSPALLRCQAEQRQPLTQGLPTRRPGQYMGIHVCTEPSGPREPLGCSLRNSTFSKQEP